MQTYNYYQIINFGHVCLKWNISAPQIMTGSYPCFWKQFFSKTAVEYRHFSKAIIKQCKNASKIFAWYHFSPQVDMSKGALPIKQINHKFITLPVVQASVLCVNTTSILFAFNRTGWITTACAEKPAPPSRHYRGWHWARKLSQPWGQNSHSPQSILPETCTG